MQPVKIVVKKTEYDTLSLAERRRYADIVQIQTMLAEGHAPVQIKNLLSTTYSRIRRYATGDPIKLCHFGSERISEISRYKNEIIVLLTMNTPLNQALKQISSLGYLGKRTAFEKYCRKLITELEIQYMPKRNLAGNPINPNFVKPQMHYISKTEVFKYLWSGKPLTDADWKYISCKYPCVLEIQQCILDF